MNNMQQIFAQQFGTIDIVVFTLNLFLTALLALILGVVYVRFGGALSNRKRFAANFILLSMTTMLIIVVVKSSIALSLGLVGALSIVRFRAAIKEPEELVFLFLAISVGLGMGTLETSLRAVTIIAFFVILIVIILRGIWNERQSNLGPQRSMYLTVTGLSGDGAVTLDKIVNVLMKHAEEVNLKRFEEDAKGIEASFIVDFAGMDSLNASRQELLSLHPSLHVLFLDHAWDV